MAHITVTKEHANENPAFAEFVGKTVSANQFRALQRSKGASKNGSESTPAKAPAPRKRASKKSTSKKGSAKKSK